MIHIEKEFRIGKWTIVIEQDDKEVHVFYSDKPEANPYMEWAGLLFFPEVLKLLSFNIPEDAPFFLITYFQDHFWKLYIEFEDNMVLISSRLLTKELKPLNTASIFKPIPYDIFQSILLSFLTVCL